MCIKLRIPVNMETMSKLDLINALRQYPKMITTSNSVSPFMNSDRLHKYEYPLLPTSSKNTLNNNKKKAAAEEKTTEVEESNPTKSDESSDKNDEEPITKKQGITSKIASIFRQFLHYSGLALTFTKNLIIQEWVAILFYIYIIVVFAILVYFVIGPE